jgi:hypothetical protein
VERKDVVVNPPERHQGDEKAMAVVAALTVAAGFLVLAMDALAASFIKGGLGSTPGGQAVWNLWTEGGWGMYCISLSTLLGAGVGGLIVWMARRRRSRLMGLAIAGSLPALSSTLCVWLEVRNTTQAPSPLPYALVGCVSQCLVLGLWGLLASAILALVLAGALAAIYHTTTRERTRTGHAILPLLGIVAVCGIWGVRQGRLLNGLSAVVVLAGADRAKMLRLAGQDVSWSVHAAVVATILWVVVLAASTWAMRLRARDVPRLFVPAVFGWAAFALHVALPGQAIATGTARLAALTGSESLVDVLGYSSPPPSGTLRGDQLMDMQEGAGVPLSDEQILGWCARSTESASFSEDAGLRVAVAPDATAGAFLRLVRAVGEIAPPGKVVTIHLVGRHDEGLAGLPREFWLFAEVQRRSTFHSVPLGVAGKGICAQDVQAVTADGEVLVAGSERWTAAELRGVPRTSATPTLLAGHGQVPPARLMKLAQAAAGHDSLLTVIPAGAACDQDE